MKRLHVGIGPAGELRLTTLPRGGRGTMNKRLTRSGTAHRPRVGPGNPNRVRIHVGGRNRIGPRTNKVYHCIDLHRNPRSWGSSFSVVAADTIRDVVSADAKN